MTSANTVTATVVCRAKSGQEAGLETSLRQLITQSRQEDGCLLYEILKSKRNPGEYLLLMKWRDRPACEQHLHQSHVRNFSQVVAPKYLAEPFNLDFWISV